MKASRIGLLVVLLAGASRSAFADAFDIPAYLARFNTWNHSTAGICGLVLGLAAIDYLWNLLVIGLPCMRICAIRRKRLLLDVGLLTLLGQVADRLGAVIALTLVTARPIADLLVRRNAWGLWHWVLLGNLACSGAAIGLLVWLFVRKKWGGTRRAALIMATVAAIVTNPAIPLLLNLG
jgi:hypothetical protein